MSVWLSIRLPQLPLEALINSQPKAENNNKEIALAIIQDNIICCLNSNAHANGVRQQQNIHSALALCDELQLIERNFSQEQQLLQNLALDLYQLTSCIQLDWVGNDSVNQNTNKNSSVPTGDALLVLEIGRSLKLCQGFTLLLSQVSIMLEEQKVTFYYGVGHTPKAARLLSLLSSASQSLPAEQFIENANQTTAKINQTLIKKTLYQLPITAMEIEAKTIAQIESVGLQTIGQLYQLPKAALSKRFGLTLYRYLLQLFGMLSDPLVYFTPAENFHQKLEFIDVIHHRQALLFPIRRLLAQLLRFLRLKQKSCQSLYWELFDSEKNTIGFDVLVSNNQLSVDVLLELSRLNLERYQLHAPIEAIALTANHLSDLANDNQNLFEHQSNFNENSYFIDRIKAKLGAQSCYQISYQAEHVPELASAEKNTSLSLVVEDSLRGSYIAASDSLDMNQQAIRPAWLMERPQKISFNQRKLLWHGELQIISAQENISSYWWKKQIVRDYFLAEHEDGTIYWVFYDRFKKQWFLHGVYS